MKMRLALIVELCAAGLCAANGITAAPDETARSAAIHGGFKVALFGDQGSERPGQSPRSVLELVKREGADAVVHLGDFDYTNNPKRWNSLIDAILGADFPYFAVAGNHEESRWRDSNGFGGYQSLIRERLDRLHIAYDGDPGVQYSFEYRSVFFVLVSPGLNKLRTSAGNKGDDAAYIARALQRRHSIWSIAAWHQTQTAMQTGDKPNQTGWGVYEEARRGGAIIATAHEHSYARSHLLDDVMRQSIAARVAPMSADPMTVDKGRTFVVVSGLGGREQRDQTRQAPWWARVYAHKCIANDRSCIPKAESGAFFAVFNPSGDPRAARFYFKNVQGEVIDDFTAISKVEP